MAPLPACPQTATLRLALCPSLSRVSPFNFLLTCAQVCLSSIAMGTKGFCWELDGNKRNLTGLFWELDENKRRLMGY